MHFKVKYMHVYSSTTRSKSSNIKSKTRRLSCCSNGHTVILSVIGSYRRSYCHAVVHTVILSVIGSYCRSYDHTVGPLHSCWQLYIFFVFREEFWPLDILEFEKWKQWLKNNNNNIM